MLLEKKISVSRTQDKKELVSLHHDFKQGKSTLAAAMWGRAVNSMFWVISRSPISFLLTFPGVPELMNKVGCPSPAVDIYSFGILMWEVWARQKPWQGLNRDEIFVKVRDENEKLKVPMHLKHPKGYDALMRRCWQTKIEFRPLIDIVLKDLPIIMQSAARLDALGTYLYTHTQNVSYHSFFPSHRKREEHHS